MYLLSIVRIISQSLVTKVPHAAQGTLWGMAAHFILAEASLQRANMESPSDSDLAVERVDEEFAASRGLCAMVPRLVGMYTAWHRSACVPTLSKPAENVHRRSPRSKPLQMLSSVFWWPFFVSNYRCTCTLTNHCHFVCDVLLLIREDDAGQILQGLPKMEIHFQYTQYT